MVEIGTTTLVAIVVVVIVVAGLAFLGRRRLSADSTNAESGTERVAEQRERESFNVPLSSRVGGMPLEAKLVTASALVVVGLIGYGLYSYGKSGSPAQWLIATESQIAIATAIGLGAGVYYERRRSSTREGELEILFDADPESGKSETTSKTVYFDPRDVVEDDRGLIVHEYSKGRLYGLYRRPKRIAEDRWLREDSFRPLSDKIGHRIPTHADQVGPNKWVVRSKRAVKSNNPASVADVEYLPPWSLSREQYARINEDMEMMKTEVEESRATDARKDERIRRLETALQNANSEDWTRFLEVFDTFAPYFGGSSTSTKEERVVERQAGRSTRDEDELRASLNGFRQEDR